MGKPATHTDIDLLRGRVLDLLKTRREWDKSKTSLSFQEIGETLYRRFPGDGRPTKAQIKAAVRGLGRTVHVFAGRVFFLAA